MLFSLSRVIVCIFNALCSVPGLSCVKNFVGFCLLSLFTFLTFLCPVSLLLC